MKWHRSFVLALITFLSLPASAAEISEQYLMMNAEEIPDLIDQGFISREQTPDPHWRKDACLACHEKLPDDNGLHIQHGPAPDTVCKYCHDVDDHAWIHPVDLLPSREFRDGMAREFAETLNQSDGRINCGTCHLIKAPCRMNRFYQKQYWPMFLRGWPYSASTELCFSCHKKEDYRPLVSHDQIEDNGSVDEDSCLLCHRKVPQQFEDGSTQFTDLVVGRDLKSVCINCHAARPHPSGNVIFSGGKVPNHLAVPSAEIRQRMKKMVAANDIHMPLEPSDGSIYCATCHNPHENGVIKNVAGAKGAGEKNFLRTDNICRNCHDQIQ